jgi:hypothetical protein
VASSTFTATKKRQRLILKRTHQSNLHKILYLLASEQNSLIQSKLRNSLSKVAPFPLTNPLSIGKHTRENKEKKKERREKKTRENIHINMTASSL